MKSPKPTSRTLTTRNNLPKRDNLTTRPKSCTTISLHNKQITATNPTNVTNCIKVTPGITTNLTTRTFAEIAAIKIGAESRTNLTDLFSGLYQGKSIQNKKQQNTITYKGKSLQIQQLIKLKTHTKQNSRPKCLKTPQELLEQNLQLKAQINKLKQQISIIKAQLNVNYKRKQDVQLGMQAGLGLEYDKDLYWTNTNTNVYKNKNNSMSKNVNGENSHRIVGMRQQYQKLKIQYQRVCQQKKVLQVQLLNTGVVEAKVYILELQSFIKDILHKLANYQETQTYRINNQNQFLRNINKKQEVSSRYIQRQEEDEDLYEGDFQQKSKQLSNSKYKQKIPMPNNANMKQYLHNYDIEINSNNIKKLKQWNSINKDNSHTHTHTHSHSHTNLNNNYSSNPINNNNIQKLKLKQLQHKQQITQTKQLLKQKDKKIDFLQKLLISRDNKQFSISRKIRKLQKQNQNLVNSYNLLLQQAEQIKKRLQLQNIKLRSYYSQEINKLKNQNIKCMQQKQKQINKLNEYIRSLQEHQKMYSNSKNRMNSSVNRSSIGQMNINMTNSANRSRKASHDFTGRNLVIVQEQSIFQSKRYQSQQHQKQKQKAIDKFCSDDKDNSEILIKLQKRQPKKANQRNSDRSQRLRKVQYNQIQPIGELLRYRMIGYKIEPTQIKQYFSRKVVFTEQSQHESSSKSSNQQFFQTLEQIQNYKSQSQQQWQDQYMNMRQIMQILKKQPFNLSEQSSLMLGRYMVEDCQDQYEYVYCDEVNENKREIVKSIIKTIVGEYTLIQEKEYKEYGEVMGRFSGNLRATLQSYYPDGVISKQKLLEIVKGIGIQLNFKQRELMIGKLCTCSKGLDCLVYQTLFS